MDLKSIIDLLSKLNIKSSDFYDLVAKAQSMDLSLEESQRELIKMGCEISGKNLTKDKENEIIKTIKEEGISSDLLSIFKN